MRSSREVRTTHPGVVGFLPSDVLKEHAAHLNLEILLQQLRQLRILRQDRRVLLQQLRQRRILHQDLAQG